MLMPTPSYRLTPEAQADLNEIRRYTLQEWGNAQARKYITGLRKTMNLLAEAPSLGKLRPEVGINVLSFPHVSHVVYYIVHEQQVVIFGVLHKTMVPLKHLMERREIY